MTRDDVSIQVVSGLLAQGLSLSQIAKRLHCSRTAVAQRAHEGGLRPVAPTRARRKPPPRPPVPPWAVVDHEAINRILKALSGYYGNLERLRPALEMLQRMSPIRRQGFLVWGRRQQRTDRYGTACLGSDRFRGLPGDAEVKLEWGDGEMVVRARTATWSYPLHREGIPIRSILPTLAGHVLGVLYLRLDAVGAAMVGHRIHNLGKENARRFTYAILVPDRPEPVFVDPAGRVLIPAQEAPFGRRRAARTWREAQALRPRFDADRQAEAAAAWLESRWRADPASLVTDCTIVVAGIVPWEPVRRGLLAIPSRDEHGELFHRAALLSRSGGCMLVLQGRWLHVLDADGSPLRSREWPHPLGWEHWQVKRWRGDRLHRVSLRPMQLPLRDSRFRPAVDRTRFSFRWPDGVPTPHGRRAALLSVTAPGSTPCFTLLIEGDGPGTRIPVTPHFFGPDTGLAGRLAAVDGALREWLGDAGLRGWMQLLPEALFERIMEAARPAPAALAAIAGRGRLGRLLADLLADTLRGLIHRADAVLEDCLDAARDVPKAVHALALVCTAEHLAFAVEALGALLSGRERRFAMIQRSSSTVELTNASGAAWIGSLTVDDSLQLCLKDGRRTAPACRRGLSFLEFLETAGRDRDRTLPESCLRLSIDNRALRLLLPVATADLEWIVGWMRGSLNPGAEVCDGGLQVDLRSVPDTSRALLRRMREAVSR